MSSFKALKDAVGIGYGRGSRIKSPMSLPDTAGAVGIGYGRGSRIKSPMSLPDT